MCGFSFLLAIFHYEVFLTSLETGNDGTLSFHVVSIRERDKIFVAVFLLSEVFSTPPLSSIRDWSPMRWREVVIYCCPEWLYRIGAKS